MNNNLPEDQLNFDIQTENEILKLKISAELGGKIFAGESDEVDPEILNDFLKKVYDFQLSLSDAPTGNNFYELAGSPEIKRFTDPEDPYLLIEFRRLLKIFEAHKIFFDPSDIKGLHNKYNFFVDYVLLGKCYAMNHPGMVTVYPLLEFAPPSWLKMYNEVIEFISTAAEVISNDEFDPLESCFRGFSSAKYPVNAYRDYYDQMKKISLLKLQISTVEEFEDRIDFTCGVILNLTTEGGDMVFSGDLIFQFNKSLDNHYEIINCIPI